MIKQILFFSLVLIFFNSLSYAKTCKTKENIKTKVITAPKTLKYERKNSGNRIDEVLSKRKSINLFRAWRGYELGTDNYGLMWSGWHPTPKVPHGFSLREILWAYTYPDKGYDGYYNQPGTEKYVLKKRWGDKGWQEYGETYNVDYTHPDYLNYIKKLVKDLTVDLDGIMFDLWKDTHSHHGGKPENTVKEYRYKIAKIIREEMGKDFIILGNINWLKQKDTHQFLNGVFLELWKKRKSGYTCKEIKEIESIIEFHDENLSYPRLVAVNIWKIAKDPPKKEVSELTKKIFGSNIDVKKIHGKDYWIKNYRSSPENIKFAKLFTAMAMVIPENGYILYGDNNHDHPDHDHYHEIYDFYKIDLGKPTSLKTEIVDGLAFKLHEKGVIAYNLTENNYLIKFSKKEVLVKSFEGVFEKF